MKLFEQDVNIKFPVCSAKPGGKFLNIERNCIYNSHLETKDFTRFDEQDFLSLFFKKLHMTIDNMKTEIRKYLGYPASFYKTTIENIQKAYFLIKEKKNFLTVENALYNLGS